jgi:hypothetical protein
VLVTRIGSESFGDCGAATVFGIGTLSELLRSCVERGPFWASELCQRRAD